MAGAQVAVSAAPALAAAAATTTTDARADDAALWAAAQEAEQYGLSAQLLNLAARKEVGGFTPDQLLHVLRACNGLVNKAKYYLIEHR